MRKFNAFTIPELLAVVALVVIIISMLMPSLSQARLDSKRLICLTNQRTIGVALHGYASDQKGIYPPHTQPGAGWADAYGLRKDYPYSGATTRSPLGMGLLVSQEFLPTSVLGKIMHCPTLDNAETWVKGHCMDIAHPWGFGGSGWVENPNHRIIAGYNYRGTSYGWVNGKPPRRSEMDSSFVMMVDTPDFRMRGERSANNQHGGYNRVFNDGSGSWFKDEGFEVDAVVQRAGGRMDGRGAAANDELVFDLLGSVP